jgi:hypothetical protein
MAALRVPGDAWRKWRKKVMGLFITYGMKLKEQGAEQQAHLLH